MDSRQDYDTLGFIYEYLISNFASNAGQSSVSLRAERSLSAHERNSHVISPAVKSTSTTPRVTRLVLIHIGQAVCSPYAQWQSE